MVNDTLPSQIDIRKLAVKGTQIKATIPASAVPRIADLLADKSGSVAVDLTFYIDDQRIRRVDGKLHAQVNVICERCLESMPIVIDSHLMLGIVWSEDDAKRLSGDVEPLIVGDELVDLSDIVAEELILSFPIVTSHAPEDCNKPANYQFAAPETQLNDSDKSAQSLQDNPFQVLEQLKSNNSE